MTYEHKLLVDDCTAEHVIEWARTHLVPDPHGQGADADEYTTATLYWDTASLDVLERRGSYGKAKYRIRRYGAADTAFLERKLRRQSRVCKRRSLVVLEDLQLLEQRSEAAGSWEGDWFRRRLHVRRLRPTCLLHYDRVARYLGEWEGPRLTVDRNIRAATSTTLRFGSESMEPVLAGQCIVELKHEDAMPAAFKRLLERLRVAPSSVSKYRHAMSTLGRTVVLARVSEGESDV